MDRLRDFLQAALIRSIRDEDIATGEAIIRTIPCLVHPIELMRWAKLPGNDSGRITKLARDLQLPSRMQELQRDYFSRRFALPSAFIMWSEYQLERSADFGTILEHYWWEGFRWMRIQRFTLVQGARDLIRIQTGDLREVIQKANALRSSMARDRKWEAEFDAVHIAINAHQYIERCIGSRTLQLAAIAWMADHPGEVLQDFDQLAGSYLDRTEFDSGLVSGPKYGLLLLGESHEVRPVDRPQTRFDYSIDGKGHSIELNFPVLSPEQRLRGADGRIPPCIAMVFSSRPREQLSKEEIARQLWSVGFGAFMLIPLDLPARE
jgi:hypothetical protein